MSNISSVQHGQQISHLFSQIAHVYDFLNRLFSLGLDAYWRKKLARAVAPATQGAHPVILDLAAGTLEVTVELAKRYPHASFLALDFCRPMLQRGACKLRKRPGATCQLLVGDARKLPLPDNSLDAITLAFGLRNMLPREEALQEAIRVLRPRGKLCVLEFGSAKDKILFGLYNFYLANILPRIGKIISKDKDAYRHLADSIAAFPSAHELKEEMHVVGFKDIRYEQLTFGIVCLHVGRKNTQ